MATTETQIVKRQVIELVKSSGPEFARRLPTARTHELVAACEEKQIRAVEVGGDNSKEPELF